MAEKLNEDWPVNVKAKALWILGEMGLKYPQQIRLHLGKIAEYLEDDYPKLRERSINALGRIGRADNELNIFYFTSITPAYLLL